MLARIKTKTGSHLTERTKRVVSGSFMMVVSSVISNLTRVGLIAVLARIYTKEQFGLWATITSATAIMATTDLGIGNALRNKLSEFYQKNDPKADSEARDYFFSVLYFFLIIAVALAALLFLFQGAIPYEKIFNTDNTSLKEKGVVILLSVQAIFLISIPLGIGANMFFAYGETKWVAWFSICNGLAAAMVISLLAWMGYDITVTAIAFFILQLIIYFIWTLLFIRRRQWRFTQLSVTKSFLRVKSLMALSLNFAILQIAGVFIFNASTIVVTANAGLSDSAEFNLVQKLYTFLIAVYLSLYNPLWAGFSEAIHKKDWRWAKKTLNKAVQLTGALFLTAILVLSLGGNLFLSFLGGRGYASNTIMFIMMGAWALFYCLYSVAIAFLSAATSVRLIAVFTALFALSFSSVSASLYDKMGTVGIAVWSAVVFLVLTGLAYGQSIYIIKKGAKMVRQSDIENPSVALF
ncbi:MAG TPA: lipopolysaccharide biosynthesis protein [Flavisolibacter sp.]|nr:lipopolysaccharide biosynthesis protein [Flavisolibacter sp.]